MYIILDRFSLEEKMICSLQTLSGELVSCNVWSWQLPDCNYMKWRYWMLSKFEFTLGTKWFLQSSRIQRANEVTDTFPLHTDIKC